MHRNADYVSCRKLNSDGCRTCKVGYVKVLADMMHLVGNRIGVITSIHVHDIDHTEIRSKTKVITKYDKKKPVTQQPETKKSKSSNAKPKSTTAQKKHTPGKTLDLCSCVHDYALITLLDGGVPSFGDIGNHPLAQQGGGGDNDDDDDDDGESDDVDTISSLESVERKPAAKKKPTK